MQLTALSKILSHDKSPPLRSLTVLPLLLSPERDEALAELTEGRVTTFAHDLVPNYLRTKLEPMADIRMGQLENKAASLSYEAAQKQIAAYQKVVNHIWDIINKAREDWESESGARQGAQQTSSVADTHQLVAAVGMGKGLKMQGQPVVGPGGAVGPGQMQPGGAIMGAPQGVRGNTMPQTNTSGQPTMGPGGVMGPGGGKAPSAIKTVIKPGNQIHPYGR